MPKTKVQKQEILSGLKEKMAKIKAAVFVNFSKISVKDINSLRQKCRDHNAEYTVVKKALFGKALPETGLAEISEQKLAGELGLILGYGEEVAPAKLASEFAKDHETMKVLGGVLEGKFIDNLKVATLSKLPGRQELLAKMVGSLESPLSGLVNVLSGNLRGLVNVLTAIKDKKS